MEYLTTHDLVWVNSEVTGRTNPFGYFDLEAAIAAQYQYGRSDDVRVQAANFLDALVHKPPFSAGTLRTALVATVGFLNANGWLVTTDPEGLADSVRRVAGGDAGALDVIDAVAATAAEPLPAGIPVRTVVTHVCNQHTRALELLAPGD